MCSLQFAKAGSAATLPQQEEEQLGKCAAGKSDYCRLNVISGKPISPTQTRNEGRAPVWGGALSLLQKPLYYRGIQLSC
jgi:hypothetical protein